MPEESTAPDLVELVRKQLDAVNRGDADALATFAATDVVYDTSPSGFGVYEGQEAVGAFVEGYWGLFDELRFELEEVVDLGNGVTFSVNRQHARPVGSTALVQTREAHVTEWAEGKVKRVTVYIDVDEARAAAERLAEERGQAMSESLDLVRSIYGAWERGEFDSADWAHPEIEYVSADGPDPGSWTGLAEMAANFRAWLGLWEEFRLTADEYRQFGAENVIVLDHYSGRGKTSGLDLGQIQASGAWVFDIRHGKVTRMIRYMDRDNALADLGLAE
jgi:ketosteroid isomerase-like protein